MRPRAWGLAAALLGAALAAGLASQRAALERRWVAYRRPAIETRARAILISGLTHTNTFVRIDSAGLLGRLGDPRGFAILERAARDPNVAARHSAMLRLVPFGERAFPLIEEALRDDAAVVRNRAVMTLGQMQEPAAHARVETLWEERVRVSPTILLKALWIGDPARAAKIVTRELCEARRLDRGTTLEAWLTHRKRFHAKATQAERDVVDLTIDAILRDFEMGGGLAGADAAVLRWRLGRKITADAEWDTVWNAPPAVRAQVKAAFLAKTLAALPPEAHDRTGLQARLRDADPARRLAAARALQHAATPAALAAAEARLRDEPMDSVRNALMHLLAEHAPATAVPHLIAALRDERQSPRQDAIDLIKAYADPALVPAYEVALASEFAHARIAAARALSNVHHPDRRRLLRRALDDANADIQVQAAAGLLMPW